MAASMKHADHRRLLSRWGKALFRFAGIERPEFARREVLSTACAHVHMTAPAEGLRRSILVFEDLYSEVAEISWWKTEL